MILGILVVCKVAYWHKSVYSEILLMTKIDFPARTTNGIRPNSFVHIYWRFIVVTKRLSINISSDYYDI